MVTGYQRQHRKQIIYQSQLDSEAETTDQYTKLISNVCHQNRIHDAYSKSCELACVAGLNLMQPYIDYTGSDPLNGELKVKVWEYNSFIVDPYFREPDMSDCNYVWTQEFISKDEAYSRFPDKMSNISPMSGTPQRYGRFYFLPENYNMARNDLYVLSYIWYKWKKKKKRLYSNSRKEFFDFAGGDENAQALLNGIPDLEEVTVDAPVWKCAVVLNEQLMFIGENPLWDGPECPFIANYWNYEPWISQYDLRSRSLVFPMRSSQFLFNYKVITNNDIAAATINAGWKRKVGAVANEDNLKRSGQGWDVIINPGFELGDCEKIIPSAVPESDMALAQQMQDLIFATAGINLENWAGQQDKQTSSLTLLIKQAANLMVFQKYFDQWDMALKLLGERLLQYAMYNWPAEKIRSIIGEEPTPFFYNRVFAKYRTIVEEGDLTATQQNLQAQQMMEMNERFQREVFTPSQIIPKLNITGKAEIIAMLQQQEQKAAAMQEEASNLQHAFESAKLQELYSKAASNIATAKERHGRAQADIGLFEERLSEITRNRALAEKDKMAALAQLVETIQKFGEVETFLRANQLESVEQGQVEQEDREKIDARMESESNKFVQEILGGAMKQKATSQMNPQMGGMGGGQQQRPEMAQMR